MHPVIYWRLAWKAAWGVWKYSRQLPGPDTGDVDRRDMRDYVIRYAWARRWWVAIVLGLVERIGFVPSAVLCLMVGLFIGWALAVLS